MNIPARYEKTKYDDVPMEIRSLFEKIPQTRRGIYIHGDVGTGKTHIAYSLARQSHEMKIMTMFWNMTELLHEIRGDFDRPYAEKSRVSGDLMSFKGLLFLDDVGSEKVTDWVLETFYLVINRRYNEMLPTIVTSNFPISVLSERIGDRIVSRIVEMCDVVELIGHDRRINGQTKTKICTS